ncbi:MAG: UDP-N-acetylmuramoyl-tripeptide--D-alanyl-D-alanine ligase [Frankiales bacterium]|jgi:UDP-N-acetylmuramoyl-tripeptide--D-alanyl-D-alanine ligase|nr:UDP-N-acetylmuramoyl-tripeptide--D-alanyl-D-alanine ligase [Frankiales bacterium]
MTLAEIATAVGGELSADADPDAVITGPVVIDSRTAAPGGLFVALKGEHADGHSFAADAVNAGAAAALVSRDVSVPAVVVADPLAALGKLATAVLQALPDVRVIGITGSNGKTTTKDLTASALSTSGATVGTPGSYNGEIGLPLSVLQADASTCFLVLEYGARGIGHIAYLTQIARPDIAVVLGIGVAHVGVFGTHEAIATAKGELVESLEPDGVAVLNADDPAVRAMSHRTTARVVTFGEAPDADVRAVDSTLDALGRPRFTLTTASSEAPVSLQFYGDHQVTNALAAATVAIECGLPVPDVAVALSAATPASRWRMEVVDTSIGVTVINDAYNANPDSMAAGLRALMALAGGRRTWAVLGAMAELGEMTTEAHRDLGALVASLGVDRLVAVGPVAEAIARTARDAAGPTTADTVDDVDAAVALLQRELQQGDVVLVKASRSVGLERLAEALVAGAVPA